MPLDISPDLTLDDNMVTETFAILAKRGGGKSNAAVVMAEQMTDNGLQWVAIDPKGDWWGVRSAADGKHPGLSVPVFGGSKGDIPLEPTAGALMAQLVIDRDLTCVLDVSGFSKTQQITFVTDFAETLFRLIRQNPRAMHLFLEEAEEFLPQRVDNRSARMVGAYSKISKQGRTFGLGVTLITQRSASLNKDALSQTDTLVLFRTTSPHDRKAVVAWCDYHAEAPDVASSLAGLDPGESWIVSPGALGKIVRVRWHRRRTFDSGATPKAGLRRTDPVALADINLDEISSLMADTIERAKADDPKALHARIRELEREIAKRPEAERIVEKVDVPVLDTALATQLTDLLFSVIDVGGQLVQGMAAVSAVKTPPPVATRNVATPPPARPRQPTSPSDGGGSLGKGSEAKVLAVLAQYPQGRTHPQLAILTGYSAKASTIGVALSKLRKMGYVEPGDRDGIARATDEGIAASLDSGVDPLPTGPALLAYWQTKLGKGSERKCFDELVRIYPAPSSLLEMAEATGYSPDASTIGVAMSKLRKLELAEGWAARRDFMDAIR